METSALTGKYTAIYDGFPRKIDLTVKHVGKTTVIVQIGYNRQNYLQVFHLFYDCSENRTI